MITKSERDITVIYRVLKYCLEAEKAVEHFGRDLDEFKNNAVFRNAVSMPIMQIGELTKHLSDEFKTSHTDIPWSIIRGMRNWFAHDYYKMDIEEIWNAAVDDIPTLADFCEKVLADHNKK